jgi:phospholipase C
LTAAAVVACAGSGAFAAGNGHGSNDPWSDAWKLENDELPKYRPPGIDNIQNIVVIYGENRAFDTLYGDFPQANGIRRALKEGLYTQLDRNGNVLDTLPPIWDTPGSPPTPGLPGFTQDQTAGLPNEPFAIDAPPFKVPLSVATRDLVHRFYQDDVEGRQEKRSWAIGIYSLRHPGCGEAGFLSGHHA